MKPKTTLTALLALYFLAGAAIFSPAAAQSCYSREKPEPTLHLVPYPNSMTIENGSYDMAGAIFRIDPSIDNESQKAISRFKSALDTNCGKNCLITVPGRKNGLIFLLDKSIPDEAYRLQSTRSYVEIKASGLRGFCYALETLKQLMPCEIYGKAMKKGVDWKIPCVTIEDAPRFAYRGLHLDVARHFYNVEEVKHYLDMMAFHKMNQFHWHLTDDQGWRIEIKKYPLLTEVGSKRRGTMIRKKWDSCDNIPYGGFYTQEEVKEVISYAAERGINVIPEIDLPGHMQAALTAYPELGCTGGPYEVRTTWGIAEDVLCIGKEKSMTFLEDVLTEITELFPGKYIHIGGDECPKGRWAECPDCQAKIKALGLEDQAHHSKEEALQNYVTDHITKFLASKGKRTIGWDEVLEGELESDVIVMSWRGVKGGQKATELGHDAIMSPNSHFYLDHYQSSDIANEPLAIGGYLPVRKCYSFEPFTEQMTEAQKAHILGVQANMWTEYVKTIDHIDYMVLPRISALAEVQWCQPEVKSWKRFVEGAETLADRYDVLGWNYATHIFDTLYEIAPSSGKGAVQVSLRANAAVPITYELSDETGEKEYTGPVKIDGTCTLTASAHWEHHESQPLVLEFESHKAMGCPYTVNTKPEEQYTGRIHTLLTDGLHGTDSYSHRSWAGWLGKSMDITIDMTGREAYEAVVLSANVYKQDWIFNPQEILIKTSYDGKSFKEVARVSYPAEGKYEPDAIKEYTLRFQKTDAPYLRVIAVPVRHIPAWHNGKDQPAFLFVDELTVR